MSLVKIDKGEFLFIRYDQESASDVNGLKNELQAESAGGKARDVILEFTNASAIYSMEIGVIVQFLKSLAPGRTLRFVASNYVCEMLITINLHKIPNIALYNDLNALQNLYPNIDIGAL
jgi:anti-anti-sigma regulatory factor